MSLGHIQCHAYFNCSTVTENQHTVLLLFSSSAKDLFGKAKSKSASAFSQKYARIVLCQVVEAGDS